MLELTETEVGLMRTLLAEYDDVVQADGGDPVLERLFPVAYRDDPDAAAEFSRYTRSGLVDSKTANAGAVAAALVGTEGVIELSDEAAERWLPVLTDLRLVIAERIGIMSDDDPVPDDALGQVYHWLAELQTYLIDALDALTEDVP
ncbi:hypothetical protein BH09ACT4_BH09ACT4_18350 [soil metagenome]